MHTQGTRGKVVPALLFLLLVLLCGAALVFPQEKPKSLYQRLGGYDALAAIVDDFGPRLAKDPQMSKFVSSLSVSSRRRNRQLIVDQLCEATGGPCFYIGRTMEASHQGLGIGEADWEQSVRLFQLTLDKFKIGQPERGELLAILNKLRDDIVEKKKPAN